MTQAKNKLSIHHCYQAMPGHQFCLDNNGVLLGFSKAQARLFDVGLTIGKRLSIVLDERETTQLKRTLGKCRKLPDQSVAIKLKQQHYQASAILSDDGQSIVGFHFIGNTANNSITNTTEQTLEYVFKQLPCHVFWLDKNGGILKCNDAMAKAINLAKADIIGKTAKDILTLDQAKHVNKINQHVMRTGKPYVTEESATYHGKTHHFLSQKIPLKNPQGKMVGIFGIAIDITQQKNQGHAAKEKNDLTHKAKAEFITNMSHDLRTPLNAILGLTEMLKIKTHSTLQLEYINNISKAAHVILNIVQDILKFSDTHSHQYTPLDEPFNLKDLVTEVVATFSHQINKEKVNLIINYPEECPQFLISDPQAVRRILSNLINNAIKFTEQGFILISIELADETEDEAQLQISIEDSGIGIEKKKLTNLFDHFHQADALSKTHIAGTGLGLAITKQLVEALGGSINVNSHRGAGSTFWISLTCKLDQSQQLSTLHWSDEKLETPMLIIDDHIVRGKNLLRHFNNSKNKLVSSSNAVRTLLKYNQEQRPFQIVMIDDETKSNSPGKLAHMILNKLKPQPMLLLYSHPMSLAELESAKASGFYKVIIKPAQMSELIGAIAASWKLYSATPQKMPPKIKPLKTLLVDDNEMGLKISRILLEELNCKVDLARDGQETLDKLDKDYDVIFLDIGLPDINGLQLPKLIKERDNHKKTPIIALTAHASDEDRRRCLEAGMDEFLSKPASFDDFQRALTIARKLLAN